jgi:ribosomal-protein-alanine N-acetyltransferase
MSPKIDRILRYMALADLSQVTTIDRIAFDIPWSLRTYQYEILESPYSHMVVMEKHTEHPAPAWWRWVPRILQRDLTEHQVLGYGGMWMISGSAHISTIAVHPDARGQGWGELLLLGMVRRAITLDAHEVTLEVRVSNDRAQNLYRKHGFETTSIKPHYYRNNDEDAYEMCLSIHRAESRARAESSFIRAMLQRGVTDTFSDSDLPPHLTEDGR